MQTVCFLAPFSGDLPIFDSAHVRTSIIRPQSLAEHLATAMQSCVDGGGSRPDTAVSCWPKRGDAALGLLETKHILTTDPPIWTDFEGDSVSKSTQYFPRDQEAEKILCCTAFGGFSASRKTDQNLDDDNMTMLDDFVSQEASDISFSSEDITIPVANPDDWDALPFPSPSSSAFTQIPHTLHPIPKLPFPDLDFYLAPDSSSLIPFDIPPPPPLPPLDDFPSTSTTSTSTPISVATNANALNFDPLEINPESVVNGIELEFDFASPYATQASLDEFLKSLEVDCALPPPFDESWNGVFGAPSVEVGIGNTAAQSQAEMDLGQNVDVGTVGGVKVPPGVVERLEAAAEVWPSPQQQIGMEYEGDDRDEEDCIMMEI